MSDVVARLRRQADELSAKSRGGLDNIFFGSAVETEAVMLMHEAAREIEALRHLFIPGSEHGCGTFDMDNLQAEVEPWVAHNFPNETIDDAAHAVSEETGEVSRAVLKRNQGIRGTAEEWTGKLAEEVDDVAICLARICIIEGTSLGAVVWARWREIKQRDWQADKQGHGMPESDAPESGPRWGFLGEVEIDQRIKAERCTYCGADSGAPCMASGGKPATYEHGSRLDAAVATFEREAREVALERPTKCPTCDSKDPARHPAVQFEGEVQVCPDIWHVHGGLAPLCPKCAIAMRSAGQYTFICEKCGEARYLRPLLRGN